MSSAATGAEVARSDAEAAGPARIPRIPVIVGGERRTSEFPDHLHDGASRVLAEVSGCGRLLQFHMVERAAATAEVLRGIDDAAWLGIFTRAGELLAGELSDPVESGISRLLDAMSACTGLPVARIRSGLATIVGHLENMAMILEAQAPDGRLSGYRTGDVGALHWQWRPAGRTICVRVPANFPTIAIEWLQALAMRRPTLLNTTTSDPFTSHLVADALYRAGLPAWALSVVHGDAEALPRLADQVLWPGDGWPTAVSAVKVKRYHHGRSKVVLTSTRSGQEIWRRLAHLAAQGCGRLCTNLSALIVLDDARAAATRLAETMALPVLSLFDDAALVPGFPDRQRRDEIAAHIEREVAAGAIDVSREVTGVPLRLEVDGVSFLRPTVLLVDVESDLWGIELPFPFVTVAAVPRSRVVAACAGSLIVGVPGDEPQLLRHLAEEPGIDKVFGGDDFDRGYRPTDPHEGYLADFLFTKKAVLGGNGTTRRTATTQEVR